MPPFKKHFVTNLKLMTLLLLSSTLLGVVIGGLLIQIGYDPIKVYLLGTPKGIFKIFATSESETTFYEISEAIRTNPDILKNIHMSKNAKRNRTSLFYEGINLFFHNIQGINVLVLFFYMFIWKKYFFGIFPQRQKLEKGALLILIVAPIFIVAISWFFIGSALIPAIMKVTHYYRLSWHIGLLYALTALVPHGFFESVPYVVILSMILTLYYMASSILDRTSTSMYQETNIQIYNVLRHYILSRFSVYCIVSVYFMLFIGGQIETQFSLQFADYLFRPYFSIPD